MEIVLPDVCKYDEEWFLSKYRVVSDLRELLDMTSIRFVEEYVKKKEEKKEGEDEEKEDKGEEKEGKSKKSSSKKDTAKKDTGKKETTKKGGSKSSSK